MKDKRLMVTIIIAMVGYIGAFIFNYATVASEIKHIQAEQKENKEEAEKDLERETQHIIKLQNEKFNTILNSLQHIQEQNTEQNERIKTIERRNP